jgi:hypothetical protein
MYKDFSTSLNIILWIGVFLDIAFAISWYKNGFFETPTLMLLLLAIITMIWGNHEYKEEKREKDKKINSN